jgi:SCP-2 sterol transfer family
METTMDAKELFNNALPKLIAENPEKAKIGGRYQIRISGAGEWILDGNADPPTCKPGNETADCTLITDNDSFTKIVENPSVKTLMQLVFGGKLKIEGNSGLAMRQGNKIAALFGSK